jgi:8-hydroxy-5-deazaflavin:NADPH oxidoreductase
MNIALIGTGHVGGALAIRFADLGHKIFLGVRDINNFKGQALLSQSDNISAHPIREAAKSAGVIIISVPASAVIEAAKSLGDVHDKIIIDTGNTVFYKFEGFSNMADAILANCNSMDVVKCFNTTGFENMLNPLFHDQGIDMFTAGSSEKGIAVATQLAKDIGFGNVYHFGGNDKFQLIEQFGMCWINMAIFQKQGREISFNIVRR